MFEGQLSAYQAGFTPNDVLLPSPARNNGDFYRKPREAFKALMSSVES
jgi:hypothetical protein